MEARVQITVTRNQNDPVFINDPYEVTISESRAVGSSIYAVTATDPDTQVRAQPGQTWPTVGRAHLPTGYGCNKISMRFL